METNFTPWNDLLETNGDAREEVSREEQEESGWDQYEDMDGDHQSAMESVYGPDDDGSFYDWE